MFVQRHSGGKLFSLEMRGGKVKKMRRCMQICARGHRLVGAFGRRNENQVSKLHPVGGTKTETERAPRDSLATLNRSELLYSPKLFFLPLP